jgi:hypothetical protein
MHVLVRVDVVERQTGRAKGFELGADFAGELLPDGGPQRDAKRSAAETAVEFAVGAHETPARLGRERAPVDENEMQADGESRQTPRPGRGIGRGGRPDHQARRRQNAAAMGLFDGLVDGGVAAEIIRADDQMLQLAISRRRRN